MVHVAFCCRIDLMHISDMYDRLRAYCPIDAVNWGIKIMKDKLIRNIPAATLSALNIKAANAGVCLSEYIRQILKKEAAKK